MSGKSAPTRRFTGVPVYAFELKVIDTDVARDRKTHEIIGIHTDDALYNPERHEAVTFSYRENLRLCASRPQNPQAGANAEEFAHAIGIINKLRKAKDGSTVLLEDEFAVFLKGAVASYPWGLMEWWIGAFKADVASLQPLPAAQVAAALAPVVERAQNNGTDEHPNLTLLDPIAAH